ncbi:MAG TPA: hypothetical protein VKV73_23645 [Chloroflexota bacterium]|nr:hypothetical protein [Chloroflexota bacterium]
MPWWIRAYLLFAAVQGFGIGLTGMILPAEMQIPLRITPLNTRFVAALYLGGGIGVLLAAFSRRRSEARLFVVGFGVATGLIMLITALHWSDFMADGLPHRPVWLFDYVVDPLLAVALVLGAGMAPPARGTRHGLTPLLSVQAVVFGALGLLLVLVPDLVAAYWPWTLPPVLGQVYGCFLLTFSVGAAQAARETSPRAIRDFLIASLGLTLLVLLASALHLDRFKAEPVTPVWFAAFGVGAAAFAVGLAAQGRSMAWRRGVETLAQ